MFHTLYGLMKELCRFRLASASGSSPGREARKNILRSEHRKAGLIVKKFDYSLLERWPNRKM
jgi:hypothetical protein